MVVDDWPGVGPIVQSGLAAERLGGAGDNFLKFFLDGGAEFARVSADGALHLDAVTDDVEALSALDGADGYDKRIERVVDAADKGLQVHDDRGCGHNGVIAQMRRRAVGAGALDGDFKIIAGGHASAGFQTHERGVQRTPDVHAEDSVDVIQYAVLNVVLCAVAGFLCGLKEKCHIAVKLILDFVEDFRRAQQH
ncbi:hypothetical protein SDC9_149390 [bioreactor metagenome]|uniref:Uncharacterized protein n=1 Tax=bioreactor metagenome TaxID=1076179 RepID=A0A645EL24_9ZZZZ